MIDKQQLRKQIREAKRRYSEAELREISSDICGRILQNEKVRTADAVFTYYSLPDEVFTHRLNDELVAMGKQVILPKVISDTEMTLHGFRSASDLVEGSFGIMEPCTPVLAVEDISERCVALVPGMAFDVEGNRMGRGRGYYDRMLSRIPYIYKIGVCFQFQMVDSVPANEYDISMNEVIC